MLKQINFYFSNLTIMFYKRHKNCNELRAALPDFNLDIVLKKDDISGERVSLCEENIVHNWTIELKFCNVWLIKQLLSFFSKLQFVLAWGRSHSFLNFVLSWLPDTFLICSGSFAFSNWDWLTKFLIS